MKLFFCNYHYKIIINPIIELYIRNPSMHSVIFIKELKHISFDFTDILYFLV